MIQYCYRCLGLMPHTVLPIPTLRLEDLLRQSVVLSSNFVFRVKGLILRRVSHD
jgi:hypothetical protein